MAPVDSFDGEVGHFRFGLSNHRPSNFRRLPKLSKFKRLQAFQTYNSLYYTSLVDFTDFEAFSGCRFFWFWVGEPTKIGNFFEACAGRDVKQIRRIPPFQQSSNSILCHRILCLKGCCISITSSLDICIPMCPNSSSPECCG